MVDSTILLKFSWWMSGDNYYLLTLPWQSTYQQLRDPDNRTSYDKTYTMSMDLETILSYSLNNTFSRLLSMLGYVN